MLAPTESSQENKNIITSGVRLEDLFDSSRILVSPKFYKVVLYFPFGLFLFITRLIGGIFGFLLLSLLPATSKKKSVIFKGLSRILGIIVEVDDKYIDENAKLLIANHVSLLDRLAVNAMVPCNSISKDYKIKNTDAFSFWKDVDIPYPRDLTNEEVATLQQYIEGSPIHVLHFPEYGTTNGKTGLLKFHPGVFSLNVPVQPILINVSLSSFMTVSPCVLGSSVWADIVWALILPSSFFSLKFLPSMVKLPEESIADFSKRVQQTMASAMNLKPTVYTSSDKYELVKRIQTPTIDASSSRRNVESNIAFLINNHLVLFDPQILQVVLHRNFP
ncbi:lipid droplet-regulating VLDL assembly factor AUP1 homolog [Caerostris extrusa]|uniref:Lipid droplet-regulating VLDL assembly factor AUP1 homolog n=1 Tax=Caerostris extrusa TaxID=172846 RepID=A0AAV4UDY8_CAEEX|nr:lipid droplet-regulating VLDL assembly factor AUP1 homolog [Caerostris extrusa]